MEEQKLSLSGLMDPSAMKKIGKLAGADIIITGIITPFGDSIRISCKAIDTETAKVIGSARGDIAKTETISNLLKHGSGGAAGSADNPDKQATKIEDVAIPVVQKKNAAAAKITWILKQEIYAGGKPRATPLTISRLMATIRRHVIEVSPLITKATTGSVPMKTAIPPPIHPAAYRETDPREH